MSHSSAIDHMTRVLTPGGRIAILTSCRTRSAVMRSWDGRIGRAERHAHVRPG